MNLSFLFFFTCLGFYQLNPRLRSATSVAKSVSYRCSLQISMHFEFIFPSLRLNLSALRCS
jgi:hypothetical protein